MSAFAWNWKREPDVINHDCRALHVLCRALIILLLMIFGNVHVHPGPSTVASSNSDFALISASLISALVKAWVFCMLTLEFYYLKWINWKCGFTAPIQMCWSLLRRGWGRGIWIMTLSFLVITVFPVGQNFQMWGSGNLYQRSPSVLGCLRHVLSQTIGFGCFKHYTFKWLFVDCCWVLSSSIRTSMYPTCTKLSPGPLN